MYCNNSTNLFLNAYGPINAVSYFETDLLIYAKKKFQKVFFFFCFSASRRNRPNKEKGEGTNLRQHKLFYLRKSKFCQL